MKNLIAYIKGRNLHTPRIAIVRFLLAFGVLLTLLANDFDVIANHNYTKLKGYAIRHDHRRKRELEKADIFLLMDPEKAKIVIMVVLVLVMTGFFPQITGILHLWASFCIHNYIIIYNGGDDLAFVLSAFLLPICLTDPRINTWKWKDTGISQRNIVSNIALVVIQIQAAFLYFDAWYAKLFTWQWHNGTAVYYYTSSYRVGAVDWLRNINEMVTLTPMVKLVTWGVLSFEVLLTACLFFSAKWKRKLIIPAFIFHFLFLINFGLITFYISITALLLLYLDDDDRIAKFLFRRNKVHSVPTTAVATE